MIKRSANELDNLPRFIKDHTAKGEHQELAIIEHRLREQHGLNSVVDNPDGANSQLTHIKEPRLIKNFEAKAKELE